MTEHVLYSTGDITLIEFWSRLVKVNLCKICKGYKKCIFIVDIYVSICITISGISFNVCQPCWPSSSICCLRPVKYNRPSSSIRSSQSTVVIDLLEIWFNFYVRDPFDWIISFNCICNRGSWNWKDNKYYRYL